jgi:hypothetical protein
MDEQQQAISLFCELLTMTLEDFSKVISESHQSYICICDMMMFVLYMYLTLSIWQNLLLDWSIPKYISPYIVTAFLQYIVDFLC